MQPFSPAQGLLQTAGQRLKTFEEEKSMLWTILLILIVLWLLGIIGHIGGGLIHLLLIVAAIALVFNLVSGRRGMA
jgi:predicted membrane protein